MATAAFSLVISHVTPEYALAKFGPVLIQLWERGTPLEGARRALSLARSYATTTAGPTCTLIIVPARSAPPSAEVRKALGAMPDVLPGCAGLGLVREGSGFRASGVRAVMTGMMLMSRHKAPHQVFSSTRAASLWLANQMPEGLPGLPVAVDELRHRYLRGVGASVSRAS